MFTVETLSRLMLYCRHRNVHVLCGNPSKWRSPWELWVTVSFILIFNVQHFLFDPCYVSQIASVSPLYQDTGCEKELEAVSSAVWLQQRKNHLLNMVWTSWHALYMYIYIYICIWYIYIAFIYIYTHRVICHLYYNADNWCYNSIPWYVFLGECALLGVGQCAPICGTDSDGAREREM